MHFYLQAMYDDFSSSNIQIEKDFTAKLSGYGCVGFNSEEERSKASVVRFTQHVPPQFTLVPACMLLLQYKRWI